MLPESIQLFIEYKPYEPAFYGPTSRTGVRRSCFARRSGRAPKVLVDLGHHAQGVNIEQIVSLLLGKTDWAASTSTTANTATTTSSSARSIRSSSSWIFYELVGCRRVRARRSH